MTNQNNMVQPDDNHLAWARLGTEVEVRGRRKPGRWERQSHSPPTPKDCFHDGDDDEKMFRSVQHANLGELIGGSIFSAVG